MFEVKDRTQRSFYNAITQIVLLVVNLLFNFIIVRQILNYIGSDGNGLVATATQLLTFLALLESGFTVAVLVRLYRPYETGDITTLNRYLSYAKKKFQNIGMLYFVCGMLLTFIYAPFVQTDEPVWVTMTVIGLSVCASAFSFYYVSKYNIILQASQSEYIIYAVQIVTNVLMYLSEIAVIQITKDIVCVRACVLLFGLANGLILSKVVKKKFLTIDYNVDFQGIKVSGTQDMLLVYICGILFSAFPVLYLSFFANTKVASVFMVYNIIFGAVTSMVSVVVNAPRNAWGQILHNVQEKNRVVKIFSESEFLAVLTTCSLLSVAYVLIIPFIRCYVSGVHDINYVDEMLALFLLINSLISLIRTPSGLFMEVNGNFGVRRKSHMFAEIIYFIFAVVGAFFYKLYGVLFGSILAHGFLLIYEVAYTRYKILKTGIIPFVRMVLPNIILFVSLTAIEYPNFISMKLTLLTFLLWGIVLTIFNSLCVMIVNYFVNKELMIGVLGRVKGLLGC